MSFYPIVKFNEVDLNKIILSDAKTGEYNYTKKRENDDNLTTLIKCSFESYEVDYEYDRIGTNKFFLLTNFLWLEKPSCFKLCHDINNASNIDDNNYDIKNIVFLLSPNEKLNMFLNNLLNHLETKLKQKHHVQIIKQLPIDKNNRIKILLNKFNNNITTMIYHHKSKKNGGDVIKLLNIPINNFMSELKKELTFFKSKSYGQIVDSNNNPSDDPNNPNKFKISYSGKFVLDIRCIITKEEHYSANKIIDTKYKLKLVLHAKEIETKFTSGKVTSVLDNGTTNLITEKKPSFTLVL